jgi:hypothetical protein
MIEREREGAQLADLVETGVARRFVHHADALGRIARIDDRMRSPRRHVGDVESRGDEREGRTAADRVGDRREARTVNLLIPKALDRRKVAKVGRRGDQFEVEFLGQRAQMSARQVEVVGLGSALPCPGPTLRPPRTQTP